MERTRSPTETVSAEEPELPRAGAGAGAGEASLGNIPVAGAPVIALGDDAVGEKAALKPKYALVTKLENFFRVNYRRLTLISFIIYVKPFIHHNKHLQMGISQLSLPKNDLPIHRTVNQKLMQLKIDINR